MSSDRDRVQVLTGHFATTSNRGDHVSNVQAQFTLANAPMLAGQVRFALATSAVKHDHSGQHIVPRRLVCYRLRSSRDLVKVWELQRRSCLPSMGQSLSSPILMLASLTRYCCKDLSDARDVLHTCS